MSDTPRTPGNPWRRRVRRLTAGVIGAAVLATGGITAMLATGPDAAASASTTASTDDGAATSSAGSPPDSAAGSLAGPAQTPKTADGRHHSTTGGS